MWLTSARKCQEKMEFSTSNPTGFYSHPLRPGHCISSGIYTFLKRHAELCFRAYADSEGPDQTAHPCSLIRAFAVRLQNHWILLIVSIESKCPDETAHAKGESKCAFCACSKTSFRLAQSILCLFLILYLFFFFINLHHCQYHHHHHHHHHKHVRGPAYVKYSPSPHASPARPHRFSLFFSVKKKSKQEYSSWLSSYLLCRLC